MPQPILATKLFIPPPRGSLVPRPRLIERLNEGLAGRLTLVSAPAGFGKTTLISDWIGSLRRRMPALRVAWLSLDEGDTAPARFMAYVFAALQSVEPTIGRGLDAVFEASSVPPTETLLTTLLNDLATIPHRLVLVLDDYHLADARPVDEAVSFLLEHLPASMHLVITTREDPALPLARLRARNQMTELRARDLRFQTVEADTFFNHAMGLSLSAEEVAALAERTEGWIAGLQLAGLSLQGNEDIQGFIRAFAGDHRYIVDYLAEEVLDRQPDAIRNFLLQTAVLERLTGPLCDAVTGEQGSSEILETLLRDNLFVVPLDDKRRWYRYHHLFLQVLKARLTDGQPERVVVLHRRASAWYEQNGWAEDAVRHALAAEDFERAAELIERVAPGMFRNRQEAVVLGWFQQLPEALFRARPVLCVQYVGTFLTSGRLEQVEDRLRDAERWLDADGRLREAADGKRMERVVVDEAEFQALPGTVAMYRAGLALARGHAPDAITYAGRVLALAPETDDVRRGAAAAILGLVYWASGDLEQAHRSYGDGMASLLKAGNISDVVGGSIALADIEIVQGRYRQAMATYERALRLAAEHGLPAIRGTADMHVGLSELYRERGDLETARQHLQISMEQGEHTGFPQYPYRRRVAMARIQEAEGKLDEAYQSLLEAERLYVSDMYPNVRPVAALKARVMITQGRLDEAFDWARSHGLTVDDEPNYVREFEHITLVRLLLARARLERSLASLSDAQRFLPRLLRAAEDGKRTGRVVELLVLQALACQIGGDMAAALGSLQRALSLAEPEYVVRPFADEGPPLLALLESAVKQGTETRFVRSLLAAFGKADASPSMPQPLTEPLSERELDVLRLLATEMSGPEIARELIVSLSTLRTHSQNIYSKLGVNNRRSAVRAADELGLLQR